MGTMFFLHGNNSPTIMSKMIGNKSQFSMILFSPSSAFEHRENYTDAGMYGTYSEFCYLYILFNETYQISRLNIIIPHRLIALILIFHRIHWLTIDQGHIFIRKKIPEFANIYKI